MPPERLHINHPKCIHINKPTDWPPWYLRYVLNFFRAAYKSVQDSSDRRILEMIRNDFDPPRMHHVIGIKKEEDGCAMFDGYFRGSVPIRSSQKYFFVSLNAGL